MRADLAFALAIPLSLLLAGCASEPPSDGPPDIIPSTPEAGARCDPPTFTLPQGEWLPQRPRVRLDTTAGAITIELFLEEAPVTASNFLNLTREAFYDGTVFHRVVRDFVIQGGDPLSKDGDPDNDGAGDAGYDIPDEFHPRLRHDAAGILSMANSGPDSGSSQFFITLDATPHLDDRHAVFGRVVDGMDVVATIGGARVDRNDRPLEPVTLTKAEVLEATPFERQSGADVHVVVKEKRGEPGRELRFAVLLKNTGNVRDALALTAQPPAGWTCAAPAPIVVPAGTARVVFLGLTPPADASGTVEIPVAVAKASGGPMSDGKDVARIAIAPLGPAIAQGDPVTANYAGLLPDGRLFDASMAAVANDPAQPKFVTIGGWRNKTSFNTFPFTVGTGVIAGFTNLAKTAKVGETVTGYIEAEDAYATGNVYERPLTGRDLIFELEIVAKR